MVTPIQTCSVKSARSSNASRPTSGCQRTRASRWPTFGAAWTSSKQANRRRFQPFYSNDSFEEEFRGPRAEIRARYADLADRFVGCAPVVDIGCGRGELLELLGERGIEATGVEIDPDLVAGLIEAGLAVCRPTRSRGWPGSRTGRSAVSASFKWWSTSPLRGDRGGRIGRAKSAIGRQVDYRDRQPAVAVRVRPRLLRRPDPSQPGAPGLLDLLASRSGL